MTRDFDRRLSALESETPTGDDPLVFVIDHRNANGETVERETYTENGDGFDVSHEDIDGFNYNIEYPDNGARSWTGEREGDE